MSKIITKLTLVLLFIYSVVVTFILFQGISPKKVFKKYFSEVAKDEKVDIEEEYKFITELFNDYFIIDKSIDLKKKYRDLSSKTHKDISGNFLSEFKSTLDLYIKNSAVRNFESIKIIRNIKSKSYSSFIMMKSKFPNEDQKEFLMQTDLSLKKDQDGVLYLYDWKEKILTTRPNEILAKEVFLSEDVATDLKIPCDFISVAPIKNHQAVKMSWDSKNRRIKFVANAKLEDRVQFKAQCKDRFFILDLINNENLQTIFYAFDLNEGILIKKELTERERLIKTLESHMDVKVNKK